MTIIIAVVVAALGTSTLPVAKIDAAAVPVALRPQKGTVSAAYRFSDKNGVNYLVVSTRDDNSDDARSSYLYIVHGACQGTTCRTLRVLRDMVEECHEDLMLELDPQSVTVTDLDGNGFAEVAFMYRLTCRGDISPPDSKLMLLENGQKYAVRGNPKVKMAGESYGGELKPDPAFKKAPPIFLEHAKTLWRRLNPTLRY